MNPRSLRITSSSLIHLFSMHLFSIPWKHQKILRKGALENNWVNIYLKQIVAFLWSKNFHPCFLNTFPQNENLGQISVLSQYHRKRYKGLNAWQSSVAFHIDTSDSICTKKETITTFFERLKSGVKNSENPDVLSHYEDLRNWERMGQCCYPLEVLDLTHIRTTLHSHRMELHCKSTDWFLYEFNIGLI